MNDNKRQIEAFFLKKSSFRILKLVNKYLVKLRALPKDP